MADKPVALIILDGFGYAQPSPSNPINPHNMPFFFSLLAQYPWTPLQASGTAVGLLPGMAGNSAVGHFTLGAGKAIEQPLTQLSAMIKDGSLAEQPIIKTRFIQLAESGKTLHILGLMSDGNSHSRLEFTQAMIKIAHDYGIKRVLVHTILDGRDAPQKSAPEFLEKLEGVIATLQGRMYAMDRNDNLERIKKGFDIFTVPSKAQFATWQQALDMYYAQGLYDETIPPTALIDDHIIKDGDGFVFVNIRDDREREITNLLDNDKKLSFIITGINYNNNPRNESICARAVSTTTLNDYLEQKHIKIFSCAESEKYAHITYFFNGGRETDRKDEIRVVIQSDDPVNFATQPAMKAREITAAVTDAVTRDTAQFYLINYANADMVGHTGNLQATAQAVTILDKQLKMLYKKIVVEKGGTLFITADHGNAEDKSHNNPAHTTNPVYFVAVSQQPMTLPDMKTLADVKNVIITRLIT